MKRTISFEKKIDFPSMIGEVTSISLDHNLKFIDPSNIEGEFIVSGTYKLTEASRIEENFDYKLPTEIILGEKLDLESAKIDIEDFYYEIENDYTLICYIDVKVEGVEIVEIDDSPEEQIVLEEKLSDVEELDEQVLKIENVVYEENLNLTRECDGDIKDSQESITETQDIFVEQPVVEMEEKREETMEEKMTEQKIPVVSSLFENISESEETYSTYSVYILREEETINSLIEKYKTTKEELESYNDLSNLSVGSKIIIPLHEE